MSFLYFKITLSVVLIIAYVIIRKLAILLIFKTQAKRLIDVSRSFVIKKITTLILTLIFVVIVLLIWGVKPSDLAVFIGSVLTVVGVAFFAQWSLLSNITASVIIFFKHPVKLHHTISIIEGKDYTIEGKVVNIGLFYVTLKTEDDSEITIPNNVFILKNIHILSE